MALQVHTISINRDTTPAEARVQMVDGDGCVVSVKVKLEGKSVDSFTIGDLNMMGLVAAHHLINSTQ